MDILFIILARNLCMFALTGNDNELIIDWMVLFMNCQSEETSTNHLRQNVRQPCNFKERTKRLSSTEKIQKFSHRISHRGSSSNRWREGDSRARGLKFVTPLIRGKKLRFSAHAPGAKSGFTGKTRIDRSKSLKMVKSCEKFMAPRNEKPHGTWKSKDGSSSEKEVVRQHFRWNSMLAWVMMRQYALKSGSSCML